MSYQYLYCAACATRRAGHGYQCSVCGGLLRHDVEQQHAPTPYTLYTTVRPEAPVTAEQPVREPARI
jgi:hypothetical protein